MANKRMFSKTIIGTDAFLSLPFGAQALYFQLMSEADNDGFVGNPKRICRMMGASDSDLEALLQRRFLLTFPSGVVAIKHWYIHNWIVQQYYRKTTYQEELATLTFDAKKAYTEARCGQNVDNSYKGITSSEMQEKCYVDNSHKHITNKSEDARVDDITNTTTSKTDSTQTNIADITDEKQYDSKPILYSENAVKPLRNHSKTTAQYNTILRYDLEEKDCECMNNACAHTREDVESHLKALNYEYHRATLACSDTLKERVPLFDKYLEILRTGKNYEGEAEAFCALTEKEFVTLFCRLWSGRDEIQDAHAYVWKSIVTLNKQRKEREKC